MTPSELFILITGCLFIWLTSWPDHLWTCGGMSIHTHLLGYGIGLSGQPAWILNCYRSRMTAIGIMSIIYTAGMVNGLPNAWGV